MAIDTNTKKLSILEWDNVWEPGIPLSPGTFGTDDKQHLIWGYSGISWVAPVTTANFRGRRSELVTWADTSEFVTWADTREFVLREDLEEID